MFTPAEMSEVEIFVMEDDIEPVAYTVAGLGAMHLLDVNALGQWAEEVGTEWQGRVNAYAAQERRINELTTMLGIGGELLACEDRLDPINDLPRVEEELNDIESVAQRLRTEESSLRREVERWELIAKSMELLAPLSVSIDDLRQLTHVHLVAGTIPSENLARLETSLFRIPYTIMPVHRYDGRVLVFAFCAQEHAAILDRALQSAFLDPLTIPEEFGGTAQAVLAQVSERLEIARDHLTRLRQERQEFIQRVAPRLQALHTRVLGDRTIAEAMSHFGHRGRVYLIAGWVPRYRIPELRSAVEEVTNGRVTFEENAPTSPGANQSIPTLLRHSRLLRPVEALVTTYGVPGYREIDPTLILAVTFVIMFGVMFGDLGHGLLLAAIGALLALRAIPQLERFAAPGTLLMACGLSSAAFGALFGSVFGREDIISHLWLNPLDDMIALLGASIAFGVLILNIGFLLRLLTALRQGRLAEAVVDKNGVVGLLLYWSLVGSLASIVLGRGLPAWLIGCLLLFATALFFSEPLTNLLTERRPLVQGSLLEMAVQSFFELFEAFISYVSNTLSYVRLGAFAVAHMGLSTAVLLLADLVGEGLAAIAVLVLGNLLILGFEGLIVAIQTLRLEYYELFGKFFSGEGVPFEPLTLPDAACQPPS